MRPVVEGRAGLPPLRGFGGGCGRGFSKIHDAHGGQRTPGGTLGKSQQLELAADLVRPALERRGRAPQQTQRAILAGTHDGDVAGMIPGGVGLLVAAFVLLVHDDGAQVGEGREDGRPGADGNATDPRAQLSPGVVALPVGEP